MSGESAVLFGVRRGGKRLCAVLLVLLALLASCPLVGIPQLAWAQGAPPDLEGDKSHLAVEKVVLGVSEQEVLPADGVRSYSEGTRGVVDVRLTRAGDQFVLVGQKPGVTSLLFIMLDGSKRQFSIEVVDRHQTVSGQPAHQVSKEDNIRLDFYFVQVNRSNNLQVGLGYPESVTMGNASATFDFLSQRFESATAVVEDQALLRLDMAEASGWAKLMRKAAVITENGKRAQFYGGGEVNIPVQGSLTTGIHTISFGSTINVLPHYDSESGRIQIELSAEVSDLTDDHGSGAPGRVRSTLTTVVNVELGQAVVLAGLASESKLKSRTGVPGLSQFPVIGILFGGQRAIHQMADNVVFIVPTVMDATSAQARKHIKTAFDVFRTFKGSSEAAAKLRNTWERK
jgi:pilus assembly protein CpaC